MLHFSSIINWTIDQSSSKYISCHFSLLVLLVTKAADCCLNFAITSHNFWQLQNEKVPQRCSASCSSPPSVTRPTWTARVTSTPTSSSLTPDSLWCLFLLVEDEQRRQLPLPRRLGRPQEGREDQPEPGCLSEGQPTAGEDINNIEKVNLRSLRPWEFFFEIVWNVIVSKVSISVFVPERLRPVWWLLRRRRSRWRRLQWRTTGATAIILWFLWRKLRQKGTNKDKKEQRNYIMLYCIHQQISHTLFSF